MTTKELANNWDERYGPIAVKHAARPTININTRTDDAIVLNKLLGALEADGHAMTAARDELTRLQQMAIATYGW